MDSLLRRTAGQSVGRFLEARDARPLGLDLQIGTPAETQPRVAVVIPEPSVELAPDLAATAARARSLSRIRARSPGGRSSR